MAKKKPTDCNCLELCSKQLQEERGVALDTALQINFATGAATVAGPFLAVHWHGDKKRGKKLPTVCCAYCPFCGKRK